MRERKGDSATAVSLRLAHCSAALANRKRTCVCVRASDSSRLLRRSLLRSASRSECAQAYLCGVKVAKTRGGLYKDVDFVWDRGKSKYVRARGECIYSNVYFDFAIE